MLKPAIAMLCTMLAVGCIKSVPIQRLDNPATIRVGQVLDDVYERRAHPMPESIRNRLSEVLSARNLNPDYPADSSYLSHFGKVRDSRRRMEHLAGQSATGGFVLLVEAQAEFYSQLSGRYRWTVYVKLSISGPGRDVMTDEFDLPAVLTYDHERQAEALAAVAPGIARRLESLVDEYLAGIGETTVAGLGSANRQHSRPGLADPKSIYFVLLDRFHNGDSSNDGRVEPNDPAGWHGGDLHGVLKQLDYLQSMGITTLWLSPVFATRQDRFHGHGAFHGYWTEDLNRVESRFGSLALLKKLSKELHQRGMRLVLDLVVNHVGYDAPLLKEHPDWLHNRGTITDWNNPEQIVYHDVHGLPDLAQENEEVYSHLLDSAHYWLDEVGVDGYRLDAVKHVSLGFWARFNAELRSRHPSAILLGEHYDGSPKEIVRFKRKGGFTHMFDFPLAFALRDVFCADASPAKIGAVLSSDRLYRNPTTLVTFLDNHDLSRIRTVCGGDAERVKQALTAQLAMRGVPAFTYGTEAGLEGAKEPENRADMVFGDRRYRPLKDHLTFMLKLREQAPVLVKGATRIVGMANELIEILRVTEDRAALLAIHTGKRAIRRPLPADLARGDVRDALTGAECDGLYRIGPGETRLLLAEARAPNAFADLMNRPNTTRSVRVRVQSGSLSEGESLRLVGSGPELGEWDPSRGPGPFEKLAECYQLDLDLPVGLLFAFKLVVLSADGAARWENHPDRYLFVEAGDGPLAIDLDEQQG